MKISFKKIITSPWTAVLTLALVLGVRVADPTFVESIRLRYFDTLITSKAPTENNIYTVNIDEATLDKYGQWPFKRNTYADMIEELYARKAGLVVWNVLMPEADRLGGDQELAQILKHYPVVLANTPHNGKTKNNPKAPGSAVVNSEYIESLWQVEYPGMIANIPVLENSAVGVGTTHTKPEIDGVNRRLPLVVKVGDKLYPSLAMETMRVATGNDTFQIKLNPNGIEKMRLPGEVGIIDTDSLGRIWIDWSQRSKSVSMADLPKDFGGAIVIVGTSAAGLGNPVSTSFGSVWPQEAQAAVIGTMFNKVNIQRPDWADGAEIIALAVSGLLLLFLTRWVYVGLASTLILAVGAVLGSRWFFADSLYLLDATMLSGGIILVALHAYGAKFVSEFLQKQQIKKQFGTYLSPDLVAQLQRNPELLQLGGDSRELSIMFTDVRGFTSISEHYGRDVQGLTKIMNRYMTAMTKKILENKGTLDKYIGDAQMAFWNAPLDNKQHALDAVRTGLQMLESLDDFNKEVTAEGVPAFGMGLGINTDTVVVGNMGSDQRFDYTCLGDGVNLASRLEGQSKPYGVRIVLGTKTAEYVKDDYFVLELDCIAVKGKKEGVTIYTVLVTDAGAMAGYIMAREKHDQMLKYYREQKFHVAIDMCEELKGEFDGQMDHYYDAWLERCAEMLKTKLPKDWDGVYRATSK
jgi:adenylate cyclase